MKLSLDNNQRNYVGNLLLRRNLVATPNTVWGADLFIIPSKLRQPTGAKDTYHIKALIVIDFAAREIILNKLFLVKNKGNVKSLLVFNQMNKLLRTRGLYQSDHELDLIIHTDRGSEFTSAKFATLFSKQVQSSMSNPNTPIDNAVTERFIRILKNQLPQAGKWPEYFDSLSKAASFFSKRVKYINEVHQPFNNHGLPASELHVALLNNKDNAPFVLLHWKNPNNKYTDIVGDKIVAHRRESAHIYTENKNNKRALELLLLSTHAHAKIASEAALAQPEVNAQFMEEFASLKEAVGTVLAAVTKPSKKYKPLRLPLRECADGDVYSFLMKLKRPAGTSRFVWARNRISATLLRWSGCRASDIASLTLLQIQQALQHTKFQVIQPKTREPRLIVLSQKAVIDLKAIHLDIAEVFGDDLNKPLASTSISNNLVTRARWLKSLNDFIKPAKDHFHLVLSTHSFRVNYITSLLRSVPLQRVTKLIGHASSNTTARYDRYVVDVEDMKQNIDKIK